MLLFKGFIHKMTNGLLSLFLLSFSVGAMDDNIDDGQLSDDLFLLTESEPLPKIDSQVGGASPDNGFEIEWKEIRFQGVKFRGTHTTAYRTPDFRGLPGIKGKSMGIMITKKLIEDNSIDDDIYRDWNKFNNILNGYNDRKRIAGEVAAVVFFDHLDYIPLPAQMGYTEAYYNRFNECNTQNASNNGIDGIFIHRSEKNSGKKSHIVINEAKFNSNNQLHFGTKVVDGHIVSQSHSSWNRTNFYLADCIKNVLGEYHEQTIIRTATLLKSDGEIKLFEIKDKEDNVYKNDSDVVRKTYASQALPHSSLYNMYRQFQHNVSTKGYTLQIGIDLE